MPCSHQGPVGSGKVGVDDTGLGAEAGRDTGLGAEAEAGRDTGLGAEPEAGRIEGSEVFERADCLISCSFVISRVICSWPAVNCSAVRVICS